MIGVIDYGMGNLFSVLKALDRLDVEATVTDRKEVLERCDGLVLPGVGAFPDAMKALNETGLKELVQRKVEQGTPLLGICLGMQLLFDESDENTSTTGLGLLPGRIVRFEGENASGEMFKVPHMGWNHLDQRHPSSVLLNGIEDGYVYFVHSYYLTTEDDEVVIASADYETTVPAVVGKGHVFGTQFHPEKSGPTGMKILKNFCEYVTEQTERGV
ncbi:imidazole glycerol phosphate synthase [Pontibacillus halophilus JSM 076056 = DSM 19796]|uniref:Imidazole glycerol phosphate synthase subunit HisH n=1 Tax=Pontibacillus halophilus JSM 076056 = DSM 19796 TaxID=1385510 RepID=A0A0A5IAQ2_9BACI|nr:imidazole glycerol phosphate synthase subunit HisH [Pontibacillus halophilus]KGX92912.1 imidazole glycerol phosphate synthase [Pontibacillus halophilus JSM 076056 = DSM 19796]